MIRNTNDMDLTDGNETTDYLLWAKHAANIRDNELAQSYALIAQVQVYKRQAAALEFENVLLGRIANAAEWQAQNFAALSDVLIRAANTNALERIAAVLERMTGANGIILVADAKEFMK